jgi:hypothetical protein
VRASHTLDKGALTVMVAWAINVLFIVLQRDFV